MINRLDELNGKSANEYGNYCADSVLSGNFQLKLNFIFVAFASFDSVAAFVVVDFVAKGIDLGCKCNAKYERYGSKEARKKI